MAVPLEWLWSDLAMHLSRLWPLPIQAIAKAGLPSEVLADLQDSVESVLDTFA
jgi:hypothetical protein